MKEIIRRVEINEKEMKDTVAKINKTKSLFLEKIKLLNHQLYSQKKKGIKIKLTKLETNKGVVTTENAEVQRMIRLLWTTVCQFNGQP